ncbi:hypothetical protein EDP2_3913 [Enterobacter cloacae S611]|uniref:Uncharacterized protein n=1 Tax=Enterobacter cloacae S611 TaxID=1399146 RepID=A0ABP2ZTM7_ENTCL|nr:hypothetical protein EDP2_3913 [Enterobacter cloacae S611]
MLNCRDDSPADNVRKATIIIAKHSHASTLPTGRKKREGTFL